MDAAARVGGSDVVEGRGDLIRRGRRREGGAEDWSAVMLERRTALEFLSSEAEFGSESSLLWAAAFVVTIARIQDHTGCTASEAAGLIFERRAARAAKAEAPRLAA
jgi:hypothetical protein